MKAIVLKDFGGTENLHIAKVPEPDIQAGEVLVQVRNFSINPVDVKTRNGKAMASRLKEFDPIILGWDIAGVVKEVAPDVTRFRAGDEVFGMVNFPGHGRAYAEFVAAPQSQLALKPANISFAEAASATLAALTAWQALTVHHHVTKGERMLIHAGSGGVGHFAVQIAKYLGAYVVATSSAANREFVFSLGADEHIDYHASRFEEVSPVVDFVLDTIGGENIDRSLQIIRKGGAIVSIPSGLSEGIAEKAKLKGINGLFFLVQSDGSGMGSIAELIASGAIRPHVSKIFAFEDIAQAHLQVESGRTVGKVVVRI